MILESLEYHVPQTLEEATRLAAQFAGDGKLLAGGHSLIPLIKLRVASPKHLVDIAGIKGLQYIREDGGKIEIGALVTHFQAVYSSLLKENCPLLPETAREIGDVEVRNKGTIGGSLAHAEQGADWPAAAMALGAELKAVSISGERWIPASEFFVGAMTTSLSPSEILTAIRFPALTGLSGDAYLKHAHPVSGFAVVGVAARISLDATGAIESARVGITGVSSRPYRAGAVEAAITRQFPSSRNLEAASSHAADGIEPNGDLYAPAEQRAQIAKDYTRRALALAVERAKQSSILIPQESGRHAGRLGHSAPRPQP